MMRKITYNLESPSYIYILRILCKSYYFKHLINKFKDKDLYRFLHL
ncbi:MAG TPA: hypothetical protein PK863_06225 [Candidatus Dojkabacteria bacterium]|nr:hypothetical protein [Candidatus Dojkabacteria bacterium]